MGFAPNEIVLVFVGRLVWEKGIDAFVETVNLLATRGVPHRVLVVGEGPANDAFRKRLPNAIFTGRLLGDELPTAFASSDLFFFPSASETFGLVSLEAIASGLPAVVADATGSKDIVRHGVEGLVCPPENVPAFAAALERLIRDPALRRTMAESGIERARSFRWNLVLGKLVEAFHHVAIGEGEEQRNVPTRYQLSP